MTAQKARLLRKRDYELAVTQEKGETRARSDTPHQSFRAAKRRGISETTSLNEQTRLAVTRKETKLRPCS